MSKPRGFTIDVENHILDHIWQRVREYVWHEQPDDAEWQYGTNLDYMKSLQKFWLEDFDWRATERKLNRFPQFIANIDGIDVHFLHVRGTGPNPAPLLMTHGWPGSFFEFMELVEPLTDPARFGGNPADSFDLIIPSLPGYGFSGAPKRPIGPRTVARMFNRLMTQTLGHDRYFAQGGDWGGAVTSWLGFDHGNHCRAIHLNILGAAPGGPLPGMMGSSVAALETPEELAWAGRQGVILAQEFAYSLLQATKFQSLSYAMMDSPMGVAAWIVEKFHGWSDLGDGTLDDAFSKQDLLTNIMIYLVTRTFNTASWMYRGVVEEGMTLPPGERVEVPVAMAVVPRDIIITPPRSYVEKGYDIRQWTEFPRGGHFTAMQVPDLLIDDVRRFFAAWRHEIG